MILPPATIKQIARDLSAGHTCYVHKKTGKLTTIEYDSEDPEEIIAQAEIQEALELKIDHYLRLDPMETKDQLVIMRDFLEEVEDRDLRKQLSNALNRNNPVRNFNQVVESNMELGQHWTNFNAEEYIRWVSNVIIDAYNY